MHTLLKNVYFLLSQVKYYFSLIIVISESISSELFSMGQMTLISCYRRSIIVSVKTRYRLQLLIILNPICCHFICVAEYYNSINYILDIGKLKIIKDFELSLLFVIWLLVVFKIQLGCELGATTVNRFLELFVS